MDKLTHKIGYSLYEEEWIVMPKLKTVSHICPNSEGSLGAVEIEGELIRCVKCKLLTPPELNTYLFCINIKLIDRAAWHAAREQELRAKIVKDLGWKQGDIINSRDLDKEFDGIVRQSIKGQFTKVMNEMEKKYFLKGNG